MIDESQAGRLWEENAEVWTRLSREGWDVWRDSFNTPAFLAMLPEVTGLTGLDIGCGEGHNTRLVARRAGRMFGIDVAPTFVRHATAAGVATYTAASALRLPFPGSTFDFATAFMSLMDLPHPEIALAEAYRVLKTGGFLQFSITHPCFFTPRREAIRDDRGKVRAIAISRYFEPAEPVPDEWLFKSAPHEVKAGLRPFRTYQYHQTLSAWLNAVIDVGFRIERVAEPFADDEAIRKYPAVANSRVVAYYLHVRCRKG